MVDLLFLSVIFLFLVVLILLRLEIVFALGLIGWIWLIIANQPVSVMVSRSFGSINQFVLLAIPFFILAGELMNHSQITNKLVDIGNLTLGRFRGGLAQANVGASLFFSGLSGSAVADVAAIGSIFIPHMEEEGYDSSFSAAVTSASALIGPIIPPSIIIVIYGATINVSIGGLFAAAIIPGIILSAALLITVAILSVKRGYPRYEGSVESSEYPQLALDTLIAVTMPVIILFGIISGIFTATEAAAVASVYALLIGVLYYRTLTIDGIYKSFYQSVRISTQLYVIIGISGVLTWLLAREGVPEALATWFENVEIGVSGVMIIIVLMLLFVGTWLEINAAIIILGPTLANVATSLGMHEFQFGMIMIMALNFGLITPPLGLCLFVSSSISNRSIIEISKQLLPFYVSGIGVILLLIYFPELSLYIPEQLDLL